MKIFKRHPHLFVTIILVSLVIINLLSITWPPSLINTGGATLFLKMWRGLLHLDLSLPTLKIGLRSLWITLSYALAAISLSCLIALSLSFVACGIWIKKPWVVGLFNHIIRSLRAVHELVWAWLFVASIGLTPWSGILALTLPYAGYLAKIYTELFKEVPQAPIKTLASHGASGIQQFFYGYLPLALPEMLSYTMYRLECAIRSSAVLSFVGLGGIGFQIQIALQDTHFEQVWTYLILLITLVWLIDQWSYQIRQVSEE